MDWTEKLRLLWFEHIIWVRHYIGSVMYGLRDLKAVAQRMFRNGRDLAQFYADDYGPDAAAQIEALLNQDMLIISQIASTMRMRQDIGPLITYWNQNRDALVNVIVSADPHMDPAALQAAFDTKFQEELALIQALVNEQYIQSIDKFDSLRDSAFSIANIFVVSISAGHKPPPA